MTVVVVVNIGHNEVQIGYAGDFRCAGSIKQNLDWLDDDMAAFSMCRRWFHDVLMYVPKDAKVVISEPLWLSIVRKKRLCQVLFGRLRVGSVCFIPSCLTAFIAGGIRNGLYIEVNEDYTEVIPIYNCQILDMYSISSTLGYGSDNYMHEGETEIQDTDELSLPKLLETVSKCLPVDLVKPVLNQTVLISDNERTVLDLRSSLNPVASLGSWIGTSMYAWNSLLKGFSDAMEVKLAQYEKEGKIPDWHSHRFDL